MIPNIILIVFVFGMALMWSTYGLFSSLLHLGLVIVAGSLAFALWEPLAYGVLFNILPSAAWGVSLLGSFIVLLIVLRIVTDKLVRGTLKVHRLADQIGGGAIDEDALGDDFIGRTENLQSGETEIIEFDLDPGNYVFFCNIAATVSHAAQGQVLAVTVG